MYTAQSVSYTIQKKITGHDSKGKVQNQMSGLYKCGNSTENRKLVSFKME